MVSLNLLTLVAALTSSVYGASLQRVQNFGTNPTGAEMHIYVPDKLAASPPILLASHYCGGSANAFFTGTQYSRLADQYGFIVIYPDAPDSGNCWDVHSDATLKHDAGGDSLAVVNMVRYALKTYNGNTARVFATGLSSGAMLSQVLAGSYPDVFAGISSWAGVPFACFAGAGMWNNACANGQSIKTAQQWGDLVRAAYPGYSGPRPKIQLWHGTNDEILNYNNFGESVKQWTNVLGLSETPTATQSNSPISGWTRRSFGPNMQAISAQGVPHNIQLQEAEVIKFFGLDQAAPVNPNPTPTPTPTPNPTPTPTTPPPGTTTTPATGTVPKWQQCGGNGWTGPTACVSGTTCTKVNDYYFQCL